MGAERIFGAEPVTVPSWEQNCRAGTRPDPATLVCGAEPVTVPSWWPATFRLREYGTADTPGAGNVTGQHPDSARARRSRATFCAGMRIVCTCLGFPSLPSVQNSSEFYHEEHEGHEGRQGKADQIGGRRTPPTFRNA
jgi:hypothetical protein